MEGKDSDPGRLNRRCRIPYLVLFIDESGGRLQNSHVSDDYKHSILLPRKRKVSDLIIKHRHGKVAHAQEVVGSL